MPDETIPDIVVSTQVPSTTQVNKGYTIHEMGIVCPSATEPGTFVVVLRPLKDDNTWDMDSPAIIQRFTDGPANPPEGSVADTDHPYDPATGRIYDDAHPYVRNTDATNFIGIVFGATIDATNPVAEAMQIGGLSVKQGGKKFLGAILMPPSS